MRYVHPYRPASPGTWLRFAPLEGGRREGVLLMSTSPDLSRRHAFGWARLGLVFGVIVALNLIGFCCDLASVDHGRAPTPSLSLP